MLFTRRLGKELLYVSLVELVVPFCLSVIKPLYDNLWQAFWAVSPRQEEYNNTQEEGSFEQYGTEEVAITEERGDMFLRNVGRL
jgi:hypothetical protein